MDPATEVEDTSGGAATGVWLLRCSVDVSNGVLLEVMGTKKDGGDADKVRQEGMAPSAAAALGRFGVLFFVDFDPSKFGWSLSRRLGVILESAAVEIKVRGLALARRGEGGGVGE